MKCVSRLPNDRKDGIHQTGSVMNVKCIDKVKYDTLMSKNEICKLNMSLRVYV